MIPEIVATFASGIAGAAVYINFVELLGPGGSTGDVGLFNITIPNSFATGNYGGTFQVLGGADGNAQDVIGSVDFTVQVQAPSGVPEPSSGALL